LVFLFLCFFGFFVFLGRAGQARQAGRLFVFAVVDDKPESGLVGLVGVETEEALRRLAGETDAADVEFIAVAHERHHLAVLRDQRLVVSVGVQLSRPDPLKPVHLAPSPRFGDSCEILADVRGGGVPLLAAAEILLGFDAVNGHRVAEARLHDRFLAAALLHGGRLELEVAKSVVEARLHEVAVVGH